MYLQCLTTLVRGGNGLSRPGGNLGFRVQGGGFSKLGVPYFVGPHNKDYSIWGFILGFPYLGKVPFCLLTGGYPKAPCIEIIPTLGPQKSINVFGSLRELCTRIRY